MKCAACGKKPETPYMAWAELYAAQPPTARLQTYLQFVDTLELGVRARGCLYWHGPEWFATPTALLNATAADLLRVKNCGALTVAEIRCELERQGYSHRLTRQGWNPACEGRWQRMLREKSAAAGT